MEKHLQLESYDLFTWGYPGVKFMKLETYYILHICLYQNNLFITNETLNKSLINVLQIFFPN